MVSCSFSQFPISIPNTHSMHKLSLTAFATLAVALPAQQLTETFSYPDGPAPGWTNQTLVQTVKSGRLVPSGTKSPHYITLNAFPNVGASVVDVDVYYPTLVGLHYGGLTARHPGGSGSVGQVYAKLQDNSAVGYGYYSSMYVYEAPGSATSLITGINTLAATLRLITVGRTAWVQLDKDKDGVFDHTLTRAFAAATTKDRGLVGVTGYNLSEMDDFKFYDAVVLADPTTPPKINTTYKLTFDAELVAAAPTPWLVAFSLGKAGIPLGGGRRLPLSLDVLFNATVGMGFTGLLTATAPQGVVSLPLPNDPGLVGLRIFAAGVTVDASKPLAIGAISNDHSFVIEQ